MKKFFLLVCLPLMLAGSFTVSYEFSLAPAEAEAARFGGGRSIGRARPPVQAPSRQQQVAPAQNQRNAAAPAAAAVGGGMRGLLGPVLAGSMLGALLFGGGFHGFGMADAVIILLGVFMLNRFIRSRRQAAAEAAAAAGGSDSRFADGDLGRDLGRNLDESRGGPETYARSANSANSAADNTWDKLRGNRNKSRAGFSENAEAPEEAQVQPGLDLPPDFDVRDFLAGAKVIFSRMQEAWDERDLNDIAEFTTAPVLADITRQAQEDPAPSRTDILLIKARLLDFQRQGGEETATVYFEVLLRECRDQENFEMREAWHFVRSRGGHWKLDGVQQVA